ncbi:uncharacterized protein PGTG_20661 [Puccinia graminis f. sp. tritici CRL 75-36-700-3]|uniref:Uncharacterized protein n=1 Tax=Puccinia graminis f. sp. tritici (strain CRL 75-36-700-3 / race SCCL) TaxID=418459 RepID=H6QP91_PUCGT|nr:uncharacterized protein PGTG_20661 [Puccinia graminis f. sp. tritici CRL 75-36-700-3]EHS63565.1 hypothetical protein PGTG_20661 [Puccinia graminis f. sp. tritici CRL 75-36-700-3]
MSAIALSKTWQECDIQGLSRGCDQMWLNGRSEQPLKFRFAQMAALYITCTFP